jgi:hypothetical protein
VSREVKCYENRAENWLPPLNNPSTGVHHGWQQRRRLCKGCHNAAKPPWRILGITPPPLALLWAQSAGSFKEHYPLLPYTPLLLPAPTIYTIRGFKCNRQTALSSTLFNSFHIWVLFRAIDIIRGTRPCRNRDACFPSFYTKKKSFFQLFHIILRG